MMIAAVAENVQAAEERSDLDENAPIVALVESTLDHDAILAERDEGLMTLALGDLLSDANGEVVLFNDSNMRAVQLETHHRVLKSGASDIHETASGDNVSGYQFMSFDNGTTIYYQADLNVIVIDES